MAGCPDAGVGLAMIAAGAVAIHFAMVGWQPRERVARECLLPCGQGMRAGHAGRSSTAAASAALEAFVRTQHAPDGLVRRDGSGLTGPHSCTLTMRRGVSSRGRQTGKTPRAGVIVPSSS